MERLKFTDDLLTGIEEIDNQHRVLFEKGNAVLFPETGKLGAKFILEGLEFLMQNVDEHFSAEERLMKYYGYAKLEGHKKQHQRLRSEVVGLFSKAKQTDSVESLASELYFLVIDWYIYHIKEWDKDYAISLKKYIKLDEIIIPGLDEVDDSEVGFVIPEDGFTSAQLGTLRKLKGLSI